MKNQCAVVAESFGRAASTYDASSALQQRVGERLLAQLDGLPTDPIKEVMDLGVGTGYITQRLLKRYTQAQCIALDIAYPMLTYARRHHLKNEAVGYVCGEASQLPLSECCFDFVFSNLMLQWCYDWPAVLAEVQRVLRPDGRFAFSILGSDTMRALRESWACVDAYPHVNPFPTIHQVGDALLSGGWSEPVLNRECITVYYDDVPELLRELRATGVKNTRHDRQPNLMGRQKWKKFMAAYEAHRVSDQGVPLTYEVIYAQALAPISSDRGITVPLPIFRRH